MATRIMDQKGFTLIELTSILVIIGILASVAVQKYYDLSGNASARALETAVKELNVRESLTWINIKLSPEGWGTDEALFSQLDTDLGPDFKWDPAATIENGTLHFRDQLIALTRTASTNSSAGYWNK